MARMNAVQIHAYGATTQLRYEEVERPTPLAEEVLIRVHAVGINPVDFKTRQGGAIARMLGENPFPLILGWDIAGEIVEAGPGVTEYSVGESVYGMIRFPRAGKAYAEYVTAPVTDIALKAGNQSYVQAAAVPLVALTAWQALFTTAQLQGGETVLIQAAAGGVGHVAVQLAKWKGATVLGTASTASIEPLLKLGADRVIDYTREAFEQVVQDVDVAIESMGGSIHTNTYKVLKRGGRLVSLGHPLDLALAEAGGITATSILVYPEKTQLQEITRLIEEGKLQIQVERTFPLSEAAQAHELLEKHHVHGKVVLIPA